MVHTSWEPFLREQYSDYQSERQFSHQGPLDMPGIKKKKKRAQSSIQYHYFIKYQFKGACW